MPSTDERIITLCGDCCNDCPRYVAKTTDELEKAARLWTKVGWLDNPTAEEMRCGGCSSHKECTYGIVNCVAAHGVKKCSKCGEFPCKTISAMLERSKKYEEKCREICTHDEYRQLKSAFFEKAENLKK